MIIGEDVNYQTLREQTDESRRSVVVFRATEAGTDAYELIPGSAGRARDIIVDLATGASKGGIVVPQTSDARPSEADLPAELRAR